MLTDSDALLIFSPYVVRFDAPFIRCWMMQTHCLFIARMCFVSDLASFDACYPSTGYKCIFFRCFLRRMLTLLDLLLYCRLYVLFLMLTTSSDADRIGCFAHSFRLYVLCFIVLPVPLVKYGITLHYRLSTVIRHDGYLLEYACHGQREYNAAFVVCDDKHKLTWLDRNVSSTRRFNQHIDRWWAIRVRLICPWDTCNKNTWRGSRYNRCQLNRTAQGTNKVGIVK